MKENLHRELAQAVNQAHEPYLPSPDATDTIFARDHTQDPTTKKRCQRFIFFHLFDPSIRSPTATISKSTT